VIAALACAWSLNLYNFMDGSDGLAATMALVGFTAYGAVLLCRGEPPALPLALAATMIPVLFVNRPPARMFLGDVGAVPLGFLAAAFGIAGVAGGAWPAWFPVLVFLPFIADASVTLVRRVLAGERSGNRTGRTTTSACISSGPAMGERSPAWGALMAGSAGTAVACAVCFLRGARPRSGVVHRACRGLRGD
jgi:UDP-N-acetylmuramyl pentapeptide phosphotransferase/UDP-N-acetylglucosamine-1-phosphate transferase